MTKDPLNDLTDAVFAKSSYSGQNGQCVEIGHTSTAFGVRDSKLNASPVIALTTEQGRALLDNLKR